MQFSSQRESMLWSVEGMKSWAVSCDIWLFSPMQLPPPPPPPPPLCRQPSSRKKPAARMDTRLGSKVEALACQSQRSSARWYQSSSFGFNPTGVGLLQQVLMFQLCPCVSSDGRHGSRLVPPGRGAFQPPLSVIHLYIIRQGPAHKDSW